MNNSIQTSTPLFTSANWTPEIIQRTTEEIERIATEEIGIDYYPLQIEIVSAEQMADALTSVGLPISYHHWSFGKQFLILEQAQRERGSLAHELVINSNPCIAYCIEDNTMTLQALVIAHAGIGHNGFFKHNYLFRQWTHPDAIVDYMVFARKYISSCEERYGVEAVEEVLDACHALRDYGVDRYTHPEPLSLEKEEARQRERTAYLEQHRNLLWNTVPRSADAERTETEDDPFPDEPQENILYFIEKNAPELASWKREIIRIVRKVAQYFFPQARTKVMNEGYATFVHYYIMNRLFDKGLLTDGAMQEFLHSHTNITKQPEFDETVRVLKGIDPDTGERIIEEKPIYQGINPYALGFKMFMDIKRMCEHPIAEDCEWFPEIAGTRWQDTIVHAIEHFKDESFILQYLSPKVIRDFRFFSLRDNEKKPEVDILAIHRDDGYRHIRRTLAAQHDISLHTPAIEVQRVKRRGDRTLVLRHTPFRDRPLHEQDAQKVLLYVEQLWEFPVELETVPPTEGVQNRWWRAEAGKIIA